MTSKDRRKRSRTPPWGDIRKEVANTNKRRRGPAPNAPSESFLESPIGKAVVAHRRRLKLVMRALRQAVSR